MFSSCAYALYLLDVQTMTCRAGNCLTQAHLSCCKKYSVTLIHLFYNMNQKMKTNKQTNKSLLPKFQLIPIFLLQVMHDYVHWHCSIDYCVKISLVNETLCKTLLLFHREMIPLGKCATLERATNKCNEFKL